MTCWWDEYDGGDNLARILIGAHFSVADDTVAVTRFDGVGVGIDGHGIFAYARVGASNGVDYTLYNDGTVHDENDTTIGTHAVRIGPPVRSAV